MRNDSFTDGYVCGSLPATEGAEPIRNPVLAMAYVPLQTLTTVYTDEDALSQGTLFPDLDKPFLKGFGGVKR
mgnify:CR=1 FL=1